MCPARWPRACLQFCAPHNDLNGAYVSRKGDVKWLRVPLVVLVDFMPTPDKRPTAVDSRRKPGIFLAYHQHAEKAWSGDWRVADWGAFRANLEAEPRQVRVHRVREVVLVGRPSDLTFPLADDGRRQRAVGSAPAEGDMFAPDDEVAEEESGAALQGEIHQDGAPYRGLDAEVADIRGMGVYGDQGNLLIRRSRRLFLVPRGRRLFVSTLSVCSKGGVDARFFAKMKVARRPVQRALRRRPSRILKEVKVGVCLWGVHDIAWGPLLIVMLRFVMLCRASFFLHGHMLRVVAQRCVVLSVVRVGVQTGLCTVFDSV